MTFQERQNIDNSSPKSANSPPMSSAGHKIPIFLFHPLFYTSQRCGSVEYSDKLRILSHFYSLTNPLSFFT